MGWRWGRVVAEQEVHAVVCCDYLVCGSALLLTIIAFCKNCINHVVTIQKRGGALLLE